MYKQILITGGAGFVGSEPCHPPEDPSPEPGNYRLDNLHRRGSELNLTRLKSAGVKFEHGDIRCPPDLRFSKTAPELIIECSAEPSGKPVTADLRSS